MALWLGQQQHWRPSVPTLNTYPTLRWRETSQPDAGVGTLAGYVPHSLTKLSFLGGVPSLQFLPLNTETRLQTYMLSSLSILLACTARGDTWVDGMLSHSYQMTTSKVVQQSSVCIANSYRVDEPRIESWWGENFHTCPDKPWVPHSLP